MLVACAKRRGGLGNDSSASLTLWVLFLRTFELPRSTGENPHMPKALSSVLIIALTLAACTVPNVPRKSTTQPAFAPTVFLDFEQPDPAVVWVPEGSSATPTTVPATQAGPLLRTSHLPQGGGCGRWGRRSRRRAKSAICRPSRWICPPMTC